MTSDNDAKKNNEVALALTRIGRRRLCSFMTFIIFCVLAIVASAFTGHDFVGVGTFALGVVLFLVLNSTWIMSMCPRCRKQFFITESRWYNAFATKCVHCGLKLYDKHQHSRTK